MCVLLCFINTLVHIIQLNQSNTASTVHYPIG